MRQIQNKRTTPVESPSAQDGIAQGASAVEKATGIIASTTANPSSATAGVKKKKPKKKK